MRAWRPILAPHEASLTRTRIRDIADMLERVAPCSYQNCGDLALFWFYYQKFLQGGSRQDVIVSLLNQGADFLQRDASRPALFGGMAGVAWLYDHLALSEVGTEDDTNAEIDQFLLDLVRTQQDRKTLSYDLMSGVVGFGVYWANRLSGKLAREGLRESLAWLEQAAVMDGPDKLYWTTAPNFLPPAKRVHHPEGLINLGLAHGLPGAVMFLSICIELGIERERARSLVERTLAWLRTHVQNEEVGSCFPPTIADGFPARCTRLAWCYGDLGVGLSLWTAAAALNSEEIRDWALEVMHAAAHRTKANSGISDAGICHGSSGVAHLFNRAYHLSGEVVFRDAARFWYLETLTTFDVTRFGLKPDAPPGTATKTSASTSHDVGDVDSSFTTGLVGVGLALIAAVADWDPAWDTLLLPRAPTTFAF